ncbi:MAG: RNA polymerase factor sigma-54 [Acidobacteria bacterium]|nr:RNA polymerase factor sigma-54 [Acidobacteriota bacterium]MBI3426829.1 RNA polymerase factor sigma-54 [Acidobacteriota bacterium]
MSFKPTLSTHLAQRLVLTPQLRQRIEMLQMTKLELSELVTQQMVENPVLEELAPDEVYVSPDLANVDFSDSPAAANGVANGTGELPSAAAEHAYEAAQFDTRQGESSYEASAEYSEYARSEYGESESYGDSAAPTGETFAERAPEVAIETNEPEIGQRDAFDEIDFGSTFEEYLDPGYRTRETEVKETPSFEQFLKTEDRLYDYLMWQLRLTIMPNDEVRGAAEAIIGNLNEDGFVDGSLDEIAASGPWSHEVLQQALEIVQQFDPTGVAARDLRECLLLQLKAHGYGDRLACRMIREHFHELQNHKLPEVARKLGVPVEAVSAELKLIRQLEPKPGRRYAPPETQYIAPEVYIEKIDNEYVIRFNDDGLPQLRINRQYRQMLENKETTKETRDYIKDKFRSAVDLLKNIEHRKQTIYKVCERIVERQREFLDKGVEYIRPMMLKDISEDIGMHLSTVSRVVNGKWAHTPQGVIELRRFFTEGMTNDDGEEVSTRIIKLKIKKMIEAEDARSPLTDDQIAAVLAGEGQKLSRRTVAKYRDQMKIAGSRERKQVV